ncbi:NAD(P)H-dependent glycerol-3-phosphate dehydrogenase [Fulvivirgaceae bacterium BMA12]|uniref:Glycerol-3-phosphate dehydrogenase [NAD(P)+] n=1 Tax=Agaribacillus aureus TaxID=3051825 RepID=A0ABT8L535_9BACT|nr:NAD(P)H-dependent glycerol-3-phosphate dehydrogenase [Fulvivirgaceae bacterium BMA12]
MDSKMLSEKPVGVVGAGSFGTAIANILAEKSKVLLYARNESVVDHIEKKGISSGQLLHENVSGSNELEEIASKCDIIFPIVPSSNFRSLIKDFSEYLHPYHILIHGTKGLDVSIQDETQESTKLNRNQVRTMSEIIQDESLVVRVGCLAGPNLARELADKQPAATVVASHFDEVIQAGIRLLRNDRFQVYGSQDLIGVELCGVLKNIIAIASGALSGMGYGENARALLISRGMVEMIYLGRALGGNTEAFIGLAGVGDLVATCSSTLSRNFTVGYRLAQGENLQQITDSMDETAEGINTIRIAKKLTNFYKVRAPILEMLHKVLFENLTVEEALQYLMKYPLNVDIDFL